MRLRDRRIVLLLGVCWLACTATPIEIPGDNSPTGVPNEGFDSGFAGSPDAGSPPSPPLDVGAAPDSTQGAIDGDGGDGGNGEGGNGDGVAPSPPDAGPPDAQPADGEPLDGGDGAVNDATGGNDGTPPTGDGTPDGVVQPSTDGAVSSDGPAPDLVASPDA